MIGASIEPHVVGAIAFAALAGVLAYTWLGTRQWHRRWPIVARAPVNAATVAICIVFAYSSASLGMTAAQLITSGATSVQVTEPGALPVAGERSAPSDGKATFGRKAVRPAGAAVRARDAMSAERPAIGETSGDPSTEPVGTTGDAPTRVPAEGPAAQPLQPPTTVGTPADPGLLEPLEPVAACEPAYPTLCLPVDGGQLDCLDAGAVSFPVSPPDPYGFDADWDGIGCEPAAATPPPLLPEPEPSSPLECDPAYPTLCLLIGMEDIDCTMLVAQGVTGFPVYEPDPHDLDDDGDGIGCEPL